MCCAAMLLERAMIPKGKKSALPNFFFLKLKSKWNYARNSIFTLYTIQNYTIFGFFVIFWAQGSPLIIPLESGSQESRSDSWFSLGGQFKWDRRTRWESAVFYILYKERFLSLLGNLRVVLDRFGLDNTLLKKILSKHCLVWNLRPILYFSIILYREMR